MELLQNDSTVEPTMALDHAAECIKTGLATELEEKTEELNWQSDLLQTMSHDYERYTCADDALPMSPSYRNETWYDDRNGVEHPVFVLLERPQSIVRVVDGFIDDEQCQAIEEAAAPSLGEATVADGDGGSVVGSGRKALQAGITVPWHLEADGDPIAALSRKVYDYTDSVLGLGITEEGQEGLMSIQYSGRTEDDPEPDHYDPHCDGDCEGSQHKWGGRVATVVMYCTVPTSGGATNFRRAGLHVTPKKGRAVFFSYIDPRTMTMDDGFTLHSGCPVLEGKKKIVTQWIRHGVTEEVPWSRYDSSEYNTLRGHGDASGFILVVLVVAASALCLCSCPYTTVTKSLPPFFVSVCPTCPHTNTPTFLFLCPHNR